MCSSDLPFGRTLAEGLMHGYRQSMFVLSGLCIVAAVISGIFVRSSRISPPRFAPPAPYHGCAMPDTGTGERLRAATVRTSEPS